jgi:hypothetical protein
MFVGQFLFYYQLASDDILNGVISGGNNFNWPISDEPTKSWSIKTENTLTAVVWMVIRFNYLSYDWSVNDEWKVNWHDYTGYVSVSSIEKHLILIRLNIKANNVLN